MITRFKREAALLLLNSFTKGGMMKYNRSYTAENGTYVKEYKLISDGKVLSVASFILSDDNFEIKLMTESYRFGFSIISYTRK